MIVVASTLGTTMTDKPYAYLTDAELVTAMNHWGARVDGASGWPSAYFAAKQCRAIEAVAYRRGLTIENKWPIMVG